MENDIKFKLDLSSEKRFFTRKFLNNLSDEINLDLDKFISKLHSELLVTGFYKSGLNKQEFVDFVNKILSTGSVITITPQQVLKKNSQDLLAMGNLTITRKKILILEGSVELDIVTSPGVRIKKISFAHRFMIN